MKRSNKKVLWDFKNLINKNKIMSEKRKCGVNIKKKNWCHPKRFQ